LEIFYQVFNSIKARYELSRPYPTQKIPCLIRAAVIKGHRETIPLNIQDEISAHDAKTNQPNFSHTDLSLLILL
jgi:hypothetical protein